MALICPSNIFFNWLRDFTQNETLLKCKWKYHENGKPIIKGAHVFTWIMLLVIHRRGGLYFLRS